MGEPRLVVRCPGCDARWELDFEPVACRCNYADPGVPLSPWVLTLEVVE